MRFYFTAVLLTFLLINSEAQKVTWAEDIACIIYSHCSPCHNSEANSSFPLTNYTEVFNNRLYVELFVNTGKMPPAMHDGKYSKFMHDRHLTEKEIDLIKNWARDLALEGDTNLAPPSPVYSKPVSTLINPDISFKINFQLPDTINEHLRQCFIINKPLNSSKRINAIEVLPGSRLAVHAVYIYSDTSSIPLQLDMADNKKGYSQFYGTGSSSSKPLYGYTLDSKPFVLPKNLNLKVDSNSYFIVQVQYSEKGAGFLDSTLINIKFDTSSNNTRLIETSRLLAHDKNLVNGPFVIPVDSTRTFHEQVSISNDLTILSMSPNLHGFCDRLKVYAVTPIKDTIGLLKIDNWDAVWSEGTYYYKTPIHLTAGSVLYAFATYSNTIFNQHNPDDPLATVYAGTDDDSEEMVFYFSHLPYKAGDEKISFDTLTHYKHYLDCKPVHDVSGINVVKNIPLSLYPNPAHKSVHLNFSTQYSSVVIELFNTLGQLCISQKVAKQDEIEINVSTLKSGIYFLKINSENYSEVKKVVIENGD